MLEGMLIGLISWVIAALLAAPLGEALSRAVGAAFTQSALNYTYSVSGALTWLAAVLVLSSVAGLQPAWHAARLTVRDVLALVFLGALNVAHTRSPDRHIQQLCLISNVIGTLFCGVIAAVVAEPQAYLAVGLAATGLIASLRSATPTGVAR